MNWAGAAGLEEEGMVREEFRRLEGQEAMGYRPVSLAWVIGGRGTITK